MRLFRQRSRKVTGDWRKLSEEELHKLSSSRNEMRMIKSRRTGLARNVIRMEVTLNEYMLGFRGKAQGRRRIGRIKYRRLVNKFI